MSEAYKKVIVKRAPEYLRQQPRVTLIPASEMPEPGDTRSWVFFGEAKFGKDATIPGLTLQSAWRVPIPGYGVYKQAVAIDELKRRLHDEKITFFYIYSMLTPVGFKKGA